MQSGLENPEEQYRLFPSQDRQSLPTSCLNKHPAGRGITLSACQVEPAGVPQGSGSSCAPSATPTQPPPPRGCWPCRAPHRPLRFLLPSHQDLLWKHRGCRPRGALSNLPWQNSEPHDLMPQALPLRTAAALTLTVSAAWPLGSAGHVVEEAGMGPTWLLPRMLVG